MSIHTVLVADDEPHITQVVSLKLRNAGIEVLTAHDGEEAYEAVLVEQPDLVITDLQMPYMNGIELCKMLFQSDRAAGVPVIVLTARGLGLTQEDLEETNIKAVLSKPFSPKQILETVKRLLGELPERGADAEAEAA